LRDHATHLYDPTESLMSDHAHPVSILRPIAWATAIFLLGALFAIQAFPLPEWRRVLLNILLFGFAILSFMMLQMVARKSSVGARFTTLAGLAYLLVIAAADYLMATVDMTPLYTVVIIIMAVIAGRRSALIGAAVASVLQVTEGGFVADRIGWGFGGFLRIIVYFLSALVVSELAEALTRRWREAVAQTERQRREIERRKDELEGLYQVSQAFANLTDATATFRSVTERIARLLGAEICILALLEERGNRVRAMAPGYGLSDEQIARFAYEVTDEIVAVWNIGECEWLMLEDFSALPVYLRELAQDLRIHQLIGARMMWQGLPSGVIFVANKREGGPFAEKDARLLSILAGQAAVAVENARLYRQAQANLRDVTRLYAISAQLIEQLDPREIPARVVAAVADALSAPIATIALVNETTGLLEYAATVGVPAEALEIPFRENGFGMAVVRTGKARFIEDIQTMQEASPVSRVWGYRAIACLPISRGEKRIGALYVNYSEPHVFTQVEKNVLATFANQTAIALENARLMRAEQRKAMELAALADLSRSLAETMNLEELFRAVERQVRRSLPAGDGGALLMYDATDNTLTTRAAFGYDDDQVSRLALAPGESIAGAVFQSGKGMFLSGAEPIQAARASMRPENAARFARTAHPNRRSKSVICAPLKIGAEVLGVLLLDNFKSPETFTPEDLRFLEALADRAALAIRNAQLYERGLRRAAQLSVVAEVGHRVTSILDMDELTHTLVRLVHTKFGYRYVHLFMVEAEKRQALLRAGIGAGQAAGISEPFAIPFDAGMVGWVAENGQVLLANDITQEPRFLFHPAVPDTRAELTVPLLIGSRTIGVLDVQSERLKVFEPSDVATLETLAGQVAIAIENARLYGEVREQARRDSLTQVYNHGYFLERLHEEIERARRDARPLAFIMLDIDFFKEYNDTYGHAFGDVVLGAIVQAIRAHVKHSDLVGRWGGEEFCIALLNADAAQAVIVSERIRKTLAATQLPPQDGTPIPIPTVSQGIADFPNDASNGAQLVDVADAALYSAKAHGRDQVCVFGDC
jgi:diguanylate cyclase (GGDEF)-like protein